MITACSIFQPTAAEELNSGAWKTNLRLFIDFWLRWVEIFRKQLLKNKTQELEKPILDNSSIFDNSELNSPDNDR